MEFPFPPAPTGYTSVLLARWLLIAGAVMGLCILTIRLRRWRTIRSREILWWCFAAGVTWYVAAIGSCQDTGYDTNHWLVPATASVLSVCAAGVAIGLAKIYVEGSAKEKYFALGIVPVVALVSGSALMPSICSPREAFRRSQCRNNLKQIGLAMHNYHDRYGVLPPSNIGSEPVSWRVLILPFVEEDWLFAQYDQSRAWNDATNDRVTRQSVESLICPSNYDLHRKTNDRVGQDAKSRWFTAYAMLTGQYTMGGQPVGTSFRDITDGTSNTLLAVEACGAQIVWTEPRDIDTAKQPAGINLKGKQPGQSDGWLSSYHYRGAQAALADGSVKFLSADVDPNLLKKLSTVNGGEPLRGDELP